LQRGNGYADGVLTDFLKRRCGKDARPNQSMMSIRNALAPVSPAFAEASAEPINDAAGTRNNRQEKTG
jgi:hypothetical protein